MLDRVLHTISIHLREKLYLLPFLPLGMKKLIKHKTFNCAGLPNASLT